MNGGRVPIRRWGVGGHRWDYWGYIFLSRPCEPPRPYFTYLRTLKTWGTLKFLNVPDHFTKTIRVHSRHNFWNLHHFYPSQIKNCIWQGPTTWSLCWLPSFEGSLFSEPLNPVQILYRSLKDKGWRLFMHCKLCIFNALPIPLWTI